MVVFLIGAVVPHSLMGTERIVVATGTIEQPLVFPGNDLVGVMLPDGVRRLVEDWGIKFPAIPELDIAGVAVSDIDPEDIIPVF